MCTHVPCICECVQVCACMCVCACMSVCVHVCVRSSLSASLLTRVVCFPQSERRLVGVGICVSLTAVLLEGDLGVIWEMSQAGCWVERGLLMDLVR